MVILHCVEVKADEKMNKETNWPLNLQVESVITPSDSVTVTGKRLA